MNGGLNTYGYVGGNPLIYSDPSGLVYGLGSSPYGQSQMIQHTQNEPRLPMEDADVGSRFVYGYGDFFEDLFSSTNPYEKGSCEYIKRRIAQWVADTIISQVATNPGVPLEMVLQEVLQHVMQNKAYMAGRGAGNLTMSSSAGLIAKRLGLGTGQSLGAGMGTGLGVFSRATYIRIIKEIESKLSWECECLN